MSTAAVASSPTTLSALVQSGSSWDKLAAHLDALDAEARIAEVRAMPAKLQARLWEICADAPPLTLDDMVPPSTPEGQQVIWAGRNTMPVYKIFEKRFARLDGKMIGYNFQPYSFWGPGYFTVVAAPDRPKEILIDYTQLPARAPEGWPPIKPNSAGFSWFVFNNMNDYCRRVAREVLLGAATRLGKPLGQYFILARK